MSSQGDGSLSITNELNLSTDEDHVTIHFYSVLFAEENVLVLRIY